MRAPDKNATPPVTFDAEDPDCITPTIGCPPIDKQVMDNGVGNTKGSVERRFALPNVIRRPHFMTTNLPRLSHKWS